ncbi:MAG: hypothetical protein N2C14_02520 [Planctomycetales bacterium]
MGDFWRTWYFALAQDGDEFWVETTDLWGYTFSLRDGSVVSTRLCLRALPYKPWMYLLVVLLVIVFFRVLALLRKRRVENQQTGFGRIAKGGSDA